MNRLGLHFVACFVMVVGGTVAYGQVPPGSPDCWKCVTRFCADEAVHYECPDKECEYDWIIDPKNPNIKVKDYHCRTYGIPHNSEQVNGSVTFETCKQEGAGFIRVGHTKKNVICSVLYSCICVQRLNEPFGVRHCAMGPKIQDEEIRQGDFFSQTHYQVCTYVEATPDPTPVKN